jgi:hypothetical protein
MSLLRCRQQIPYHDRSIKRIDLRELRPHHFSQRPGFQLSLPQMFEVKDRRKNNFTDWVR